MQLADFMRLVDAYGANPDRWPPEQRAAGLALMNGDPTIEAALREARLLDRILDGAPDQTPSPALRATVADAALSGGRRPRPRPLSARTSSSIRRSPRRWTAAAALAAATMAGAVTGVAAATHQIQPSAVAASSDPAVDAAGLLADPIEAEG
jgi:hypothetical protein